MRVLFFFFYFIISFSVFSKDFHFSEIKFNGLHNFSDDYVLEQLISDSRVADDDFFCKIVDLNIFDNVKVYVNDDNILNIDVVEKPVIRFVKTFGDVDLHFYSLLVKFKIKSGEFYNRSFFDVFRCKLEEYYLSNGFNNVDLNINIEFNSVLNSVDININILKNSVLKVKKINFTGNEVFDGKKLLSLFSQSPSSWTSWFFKDDVYLKGRIIYDLRRVRSYYLTKGYIDFQVNFVKVFLSKNKKTVSILIDVSEGEKHNFGNIRLEGRCTQFLRNELNNILSLYVISDSVFSYDKLVEARVKLRDFFYEHGYLHIVLDFHVINLDGKNVDVVFVFNVSPKVLVRRVEFVGNFLTSDNVLRRFVSQLEGTRLSLDDVNFGKDEIIRHGLANGIGVDIIKTAEKSEVDIVYRIEENKSSKFVTGCSYSQLDGLILNLSADLSNVLGTGKDLTFSINKSQKYSDYNFTYVDSQFQSYNFDVSYSFFYKKELFDQYVAYFDHVADTFGASVFYHSKIGKYKKLNIGVGYDKTHLKMSEDRAPSEIVKFVGKQGSKYKDYYITSTFIYNSLDRMFLPTSGILQHLNVKLSFPGSSLKYYFLNCDFNYYNRLSTNYILGFYFNLCYGNKYADTVGFPFFRNFFLRGMNNIRGFKDKSLGPRDSNDENIGGNLLFSAKFSLYFPFPFLLDLDNVRSSLFFDTGQTYSTKNFSNKHPGGTRFTKYNSFFRCSCGVALTWYTPFGIPIDVSVAYPLNADDIDKKRILSFSMGAHHS